MVFGDFAEGVSESTDNGDDKGRSVRCQHVSARGQVLVQYMNGVRFHRFFRAAGDPRAWCRFPGLEMRKASATSSSARCGRSGDRYAGFAFRNGHGPNRAGLRGRRFDLRLALRKQCSKRRQYQRGLRHAKCCRRVTVRTHGFTPLARPPAPAEFTGRARKISPNGNPDVQLSLKRGLTRPCSTPPSASPRLRWKAMFSAPGACTVRFPAAPCLPLCS